MGHMSVNKVTLHAFEEIQRGEQAFRYNGHSVIETHSGVAGLSLLGKAMQTKYSSPSLSSGNMCQDPPVGA